MKPLHKAFLNPNRTSISYLYAILSFIEIVFKSFHYEKLCSPRLDWQATRSS